MSATMPARVTPCYSDDPAERRELSRLFDSTDLYDHNEARRLCWGCPFAEECYRIAAEISVTGRWAGAPSGTWGGWLWRGGKPVQNRTVRRVCAHADEDGRGMHYLEPGELCPDDPRCSA